MTWNQCVTFCYTSILEDNSYQMSPLGTTYTKRRKLTSTPWVDRFLKYFSSSTIICLISTSMMKSISTSGETEYITCWAKILSMRPMVGFGPKVARCLSISKQMGRTQA